MKFLNDAKKKEKLTEWGYAIGGSFIYAIGFNMLIVPLGLYSGGFMGLTQLLARVFTHGLGIAIPSSFNLVSVLYFIMNLPLFYMGYKIMGKEFVIKSVIGVGIVSAALAVVPISTVPVIEDYLTAGIIGGIVCGAGTGLMLRGRVAGGGQDIVGMCMAKRYPNFSVGKISILINIFVYGVCFFLFDVQMVIYSLIYATVVSVAVDKVHIQNINTSVMIFTKKMGISKAIMEQTGRGVTNWDGEGAYTNKTSYILFVMISKYEVNQIKKIVHSIDPNAFMIFTDGCSVEGNFEKRL